jgi:REP element-mobilizing transposase RayT
MDKITIVLIDKILYHTNMNTTYKSNNNVVYSCKYHVVWCPKYRRKVLTNGVDVRLKELLTEYAANLSVDILEMEIMPDHVHMLLEVDPQFGIHKAVVQRLYVQNFKTGISLSQNENADALDKQLFCIYRWRCPAGSSKTVYRKPENIAETKG